MEAYGSSSAALKESHRCRGLGLAESSFIPELVLLASPPMASVSSEAIPATAPCGWAYVSVHHGSSQE